MRASSSPQRRRRIGIVEPEYIRNLVKAPAKLEASVIEERRAGATLKYTKAQRGSWNAHLAQLLHSAYLVTLVEKAQLGAMQQDTPTVFKTPEGHPAVACASEPTPPMPLYSVAVDTRWLEAVTRYCHFTFTLDDLARVAMTFPEYVRVHWSVERATKNLPLEDALSFHPNDGKASAHSRTSQSGKLIGQKDGCADPSRSSHLLSRLYLLQRTVVSVAEAERSLESELSRKGTAVAQRAWRELVNRHTAFAAYLDEMGETVRREARLSSLTAGPNANIASGRDALSATGAIAPSDPLDGIVEEEEELMKQLSHELRSSLSAPKLQALLRQMREDAAHTQEREQKRTSELLLQERLHSTYEHIRALFGIKHTQGRSAASLIRVLRAESRFEDAPDVVGLLSALLTIPTAGLVATMLLDAEPAEVSSTGVSKSTVSASGSASAPRKRPRSSEVEATAAPPLTQPVFERVTDLRGLTDAQLELVHIRLEPTKGSVRSVMEEISAGKEL